MFNVCTHVVSFPAASLIVQLIVCVPTGIFSPDNVEPPPS